MSRSTIVFAYAVILLSASACGTDAPRTATNANRAANSNAASNSGSTTSATDLTREAFDKERDRFAKEASDLGRKVGKGPDDLWLWARTRAALAMERDLRDATVTVDVEQNVVTLNGSVATMMAKLRAESIVRGIEGVKGVTNLLKVGSAAGTANANT